MSLYLAVNNLFHSGRRHLKDLEFRRLLLLTAVILAAGTLFYHFIEQWRWLDSLYFSVMTLSTVGYGDLTPLTDAGKIFTVIYIFFGIGVILSFINVVARREQHTAIYDPKKKV